VQAARRHPGEVGARRRPWAQRPSAVAHPHPRAGGRGDGRRAAGAGTCRRGAGGAKRVMPPNPCSRPAHLRHGVQAARRHPVKWPPADVAGCGRLPCAAHPPPRAGGRGDGQCDGGRQNWL
jgi:hypothetical protein